MPDVRHVQINVWLGSRQQVSILADNRVLINACDALDPPMKYSRFDLGSVGDIPALILELGEKLSEATKQGDKTISICEDDNKIVLCE